MGIVRKGPEKEKPVTEGFKKMLKDGCACGAKKNRITEKTSFLGDEIAECGRCGLQVLKHYTEDLKK